MSDASSRGFLDVRQIRVPIGVVHEVHAHLRHVGRLGLEGVAFWAGRQEGVIFEVTDPVIPTQRTGRTADGGLAVIVDGEALFRMNVWLHRHQLTLIAQVHSHPGDAYHSDTDDAYAIQTRVGGLSIVVPDFAHAPFSLQTVAVHRLTPGGVWQLLSPTDVLTLIQVVRPSGETSRCSDCARS
jgi:hypothetical protein